jgi:hypothetical protein
MRAQSGAKQGLEDRAKKDGLPPTKMKVYGYKNQHNTYVPDTNYSNACLIWNLALEGKRNKAICKELVKRGIPTPSNKIMWEPSSLRAMLTNPIYAGRVGTLRYEKVFPKARRKDTFGKTSYRIKPMEEWHFLEGLVERPIVAWEQFMVVQERLKLNKQHSLRNAKRFYLLRGIIKCQVCHRIYYGVTQTGNRPTYACSAAWAQTHGKKCVSKAIPCPRIEGDTKAKIRSFLESPSVYLREVRGRQGITDRTIVDLEEALKGNEREYKKTIDDERRKANSLSDEAFKQEQALITARRTWLAEENERIGAKIANLQRQRVTEDMVVNLRQRLETNLGYATDRDWRFIFESVGLKVLAFGDGTWDFEVNIPIPRREEAALINNKIPSYIYPC